MSGLGAVLGGQSLESLEKKGALEPWAQTHSQRLDLVKDLDHLTEQLIQCQQNNCTELKELYLEGVSLVIALKEPKVHWELEQCRKAGHKESFCIDPFVQAYNRWYKVMDKKIEDKKKQGTKERTPKW